MEAALAAVLQVELPSGPDFHYNNSFGPFRQSAGALRAEIRRLLMQVQVCGGTQQVDADELMDSEDGASAMSEMVESLLDDLLEKVDASLDRARAQLKAQPSGAPAGRVAAAEAAVPGASLVAGSNAAADKRARSAFAAAHTDVSFGPRLQDGFNPPVDNSNAPFRPRLEHWDGFQEREWRQESNALDVHAQRLGVAAAGSHAAVHPLEGVLESFTYQDWQLEAPEPLLPQGLDEMPLTYVDTPEGLHSLAAALSAVREIAVDLEAHSYRSFQGFCCLMQLSTRTADYLVDVITLRSIVGPVLAPIFADVKILKVLHGADSDIVWLQRDFGIYVANLFDTGQAARVLAFPSAGLAYLLSHFCSVKADKRWQLADWRVRPLSAEALHYARMDTHYLLYIYDCLKVELAKVPRVPDHLRSEVPQRGPTSCLGVVLERSRLLCLQRYEKELFSESAYLDYYRRCHERLTREQLAVFAGLYAWRDRTARQRDESTGFVLPKSLLLKLAKRAPCSAHDLRAVLGIQGRRSSPLLMELAGEVVEVIQNSKQQVDGVPDPDELPGDSGRRPSAAAALAERNAALEEAFSATDTAAPQRGASVGTAAGLGPVAMEEDGATAAEDKPHAGGLEAQLDAEEAAAVAEASAGRGGKASGGAGESCESRKESASAPAARPTDPEQLPVMPQQAPPLIPKQLPPLVPKQLQPLGGAARSGSGVGAMLGAGPGRPSALGALFGGRPQPSAAPAVSRAQASAGIEVQEAHVSAAAAVHSQAGSLHNAAGAASGGSEASAARSGVTQHAGSFGRPSSGLGAAFGGKSGRSSSGLGALLGGRRATAVVSATSSVVAAVQGTPANGSASDAAKMAVEQLKANFELPFSLPRAGAPVNPEALASDSAARDDLATPQAPAADIEEAAENPEERRAAQAVAVRDVLEQMHSENRFGALRSDTAAAPAQSSGPSSLGAAQEQEPDQTEEDFLPLPISEQYKLPGKKKRRITAQAIQAAEPRGPTREQAPAHGMEQAPSGEQPESADADCMSPEVRERLRCAADIRATLKAVGLDDEALESSLKASSKKQKKSKKKLGGPAASERVEDAGKDQPHKKKEKKQEAELDQTPPQGNAEGDAAAVAVAAVGPAVIPFDFAAARMLAKGLDVTGGISGRGGMPRGRGSVGRGFGRGGRGRGDDREKGAKRKGFNPWDSIQEEAIKGGKRSAVMPRSGNRSMTFG
ncbi:g7729 [Coccomyxa elongata]